MHRHTAEPKRTASTWWTFLLLMVLGLGLAGLAGCSDLPRDHGAGSSSSSSSGGHGGGCH